MKNNIHNRSESDIKRAINEWVATPSTYTVLDYECLFNSADDTEEISDIEDEKAESLDAISDEDNSHGAGAHSSNEFEDEPTNEVHIHFLICLHNETLFENYRIACVRFNCIAISFCRQFCANSLTCDFQLSVHLL